MITRYNAHIFKAFFTAHPGPVKEEEVEAWRKEHPELKWKVSTIRAVRTTLIKNNAIPATQEEKNAIWKKTKRKGTPLGSFLRTKKAGREAIHRNMTSHIRSI